MNVFNRLVMVFLLLVIIVVVAVLAIAPLEVLNLVNATTAWLLQLAEAYANGPNWPVFAAGRVVAGGLIVIFCLFMLWLELRRPRKKTIRAQKIAGGEARITIDSIAQRLAYNIDQLPDVIKVTPRITERSRGVDIDLKLETSPDIDVPMKTEEVMQVTREVIVERLGLKLGKVRVQIKHAPYPKE